MAAPLVTPTLRTIVYVDGFNLYYRALRGTPHRWLDLRALSEAVLRPSNTVVAIRYFTADVSGKRDPGTPERQQAYLRALRRTPGLSVHKGHFLTSLKWAEVAASSPTFLRPHPLSVATLKTEEKGSDVNLATYLVRDAFTDQCDVAVVLSNDTDLVEPIRVVREELDKPVGLICPSPRPAKSLAAVASFCRMLTPARLAAAQFPNPIPGTSIRKPEAW